jgi:hypothetical protein
VKRSLDAAVSLVKVLVMFLIFLAENNLIILMPLKGHSKMKIRKKLMFAQKRMYSSFGRRLAI